MATTPGANDEGVVESESQSRPEPEPEPEPEPAPVLPSPPPISLCKCLLGGDSEEEVVISERKNLVLSTVARTENYLRERRIPELLRFLLTKVLANRSKNPAAYSEKLIDQCMLFRAGFGPAPVLYEDRHVEAVVKSFDPGQRGWLSAGQVRRAFITLGLNPIEDLDERVPTDVVLEVLKITQENELYELLMAGMQPTQKTDDDSHSISTD